MLNLFLYFPVFFIGLAVGSFLNCVIYRLKTGEGFLRGRSFCPHCRQKLSWLDLIPVFSFLILKGKCHYCSKKISWQYPLVEVTTGGLFVLIASQSFSITYSGFLLIASCFLIVIFVYDFKHFLIPDKVIYPAIAISFLYQLFMALDFKTWKLDSGSLFYPLLAAFLASAFFLIIFLISRGRWLGFGDVKLVFFLGLLLSWPNILVALFSAFFIGALIGTGLIIFGQKTLKSAVPFAPFLVIGTFIALFWGEKFMDWYLAFIIY